MKKIYTWEGNGFPHFLWYERLRIYIVSEPDRKVKELGYYYYFFLGCKKGFIVIWGSQGCTRHYTQNTASDIFLILYMHVDYSGHEKLFDAFSSYWSLILSCDFYNSIPVKLSFHPFDLFNVKKITNLPFFPHFYATLTLLFFRLF